MTRRPVLLALIVAAFCLVGGRMAFASESTDLKVKLASLKDQIDQEKDKARKEDLKRQEKQLKEQVKVAEEKEKKAADMVDKDVGGKEKKTETAAKSEAQGLNKFARFWTQEIGKPMRKFFHGN